MTSFVFLNVHTFLNLYIIYQNFLHSRVVWISLFIQIQQYNLFFPTYIIFRSVIKEQVLLSLNNLDTVEWREGLCQIHTGTTLWPCSSCSFVVCTCIIKSNYPVKFLKFKTFYSSQNLELWLKNIIFQSYKYDLL